MRRLWYARGISTFSSERVRWTFYVDRRERALFGASSLPAEVRCDVICSKGGEEAHRSLKVVVGQSYIIPLPLSTSCSSFFYHHTSQASQMLHADT